MVLLDYHRFQLLDYSYWRSKLWWWHLVNSCRQWHSAVKFNFTKQWPWPGSSACISSSDSSSAPERSKTLRQRAQGMDADTGGATPGLWPNLKCLNTKLVRQTAPCFNLVFLNPDKSGVLCTRVSLLTRPGQWSPGERITAILIADWFEMFKQITQ